LPSPRHRPITLTAPLIAGDISFWYSPMNFALASCCEESTTWSVPLIAGVPPPIASPGGIGRRPQYDRYGLSLSKHSQSPHPLPGGQPKSDPLLELRRAFFCLPHRGVCSWPPSDRGDDRGANSGFTLSDSIFSPGTRAEKIFPVRDVAGEGRLSMHLSELSLETIAGFYFLSFDRYLTCEIDTCA